MKNPKIIPSEPTHPRILSEEGVDEEDQNRDVEAINKPAPMPKPTKNCRTFSEDDDDSGRFAMNDAESWAAWDAAHPGSGIHKGMSPEHLDAAHVKAIGNTTGGTPEYKERMKTFVAGLKAAGIKPEDHAPDTRWRAKLESMYKRF